jgi:hypothetical protein
VQTINYSYDAVGRETVRQWSGVQVDTSYDCTGRLNRRRYRTLLALSTKHHR